MIVKDESKHVLRAARELETSGQRSAGPPSPWWIESRNPCRPQRDKMTMLEQARTAVPASHATFMKRRRLPHVACHAERTESFREPSARGRHCASQMLDN